MSLQIGIVGLPNVGKSAVFNTLTGAGGGGGLSLLHHHRP